MAKSSAQALKSLAAANRKPNPVGGENKAKRVTFEKVANGITSETSSNGGDGPYQEPEKNIHASMSHAVKHLKSKFGDV